MVVGCGVAQAATGKPHSGRREKELVGREIRREIAIYVGDTCKCAFIGPLLEFAKMFV